MQFYPKAWRKATIATHCQPMATGRATKGMLHRNVALPIHLEYAPSFGVSAARTFRQPGTQSSTTSVPCAAPWPYSLGTDLRQQNSCSLDSSEIVSVFRKPNQYNPTTTREPVICQPRRNNTCMSAVPEGSWVQAKPCVTVSMTGVRRVSGRRETKCACQASMGPPRPSLYPLASQTITSSPFRPGVLPHRML